MQDHLTMNTWAIPSRMLEDIAQKTPLLQARPCPSQAWREPGLLLTQMCEAHECCYTSDDPTGLLHWWHCFSYSFMVTSTQLTDMNHSLLLIAMSEQ